jgi:putative tryptophan/tyrosine transport system substrate-binding protein
MRRRAFILTLAGAAAWPLVARAQQQPNGTGQRPKTHRIAVVALTLPAALLTETSPSLYWREFFLELKRLGYAEGENLIVQRFSAEGNPHLYSGVVAAVIRSAPDVIFAFTARLVKLLMNATSVIPIIGHTSDPVSFGLVTNLARPGANVTGVSIEAGVEIDGKRLSLLKEIVPTAARFAVLSPRAFWTAPMGSAIREVAGQLGFSVVGRPLEEPVDEAEFRSAFAALQSDRADVVFVPNIPETYTNLELVAELADRARLPMITASRHFMRDRSLMSYGPDPDDLVRRAARYVDEVLRGAKPAELPFVQPTKFELIVNLKVAKAFGFTVPDTLLATADEVLE